MVLELRCQVLDLAPIKWSGIEVPDELSMRSVQKRTQPEGGSKAVTVGLHMCHEIVRLVSGEEFDDILWD